LNIFSWQIVIQLSGLLGNLKNETSASLIHQFYYMFEINIKVQQTIQCNNELIYS